jgi:sortase A
MGAGLLLWLAAHQLMTASDRRQYDVMLEHRRASAPEDLWVLDPTLVPMLTPISCYPFNYIGPAPERFIVRAERIS